MSNNIIDFRDYVQNRLVHEALPDLPDIPIIQEATSIFGDKMLRLILLGQLCLEANDAIIAAGFDPVDFHIDDKSVDRFMITNHLNDDDAMFNGVFFDWLTEQGILIRVATSLVFDEGQPCPSIIDILRIGPDDDHWEILDEGEWDDDGPPAEFFEYLEEAWEDSGNDATEYDNDRTIAQLDISVETYNVLDEAGIDTMDELAELKEKTVRMLVGDRGLDEIKEALAVEWLSLR